MASREVGLAAVDTVGVVAQARFHVIDLLAGYGRIDSKDLDFNLKGDIRNGIFGEPREIAAHVGRRHFHILCKRFAHLSDAISVTDAC